MQLLAIQTPTFVYFNYYLELLSEPYNIVYIMNYSLIYYVKE